MDKSLRLVIERMKTAKKIKIEFDDIEIRPIYDDKILAHDIAIAFQGYANRNLTQKVDRISRKEHDTRFDNQLYMQRHRNHLDNQG